MMRLVLATLLRDLLTGRASNRVSTSRYARDARRPLTDRAQLIVNLKHRRTVVVFVDR
jgi:hypothetical protein